MVLRPLFVVLLMAFLLVALAELSEINDYASIAAGVVAVGVPLLVGGAWLWKWKRLKNPIAVRFLLPQAHYQAKDFPGGPDREGFTDALMLGIGRYLVTWRVTARISVEIERWELRFIGANAPTARDARQHLRDSQGRDWHGFQATIEPKLPEKIGPRDDASHLLLAREVEGVKPFRGQVELRFVVSAWGKRRTVVYPLDLTMAEGSSPHRYLEVP